MLAKTTSIIHTILVAYSLVAISSCSFSTKETISPDGKISVSVYVDSISNTDYGQAFFSISYKDKSSKKTLFSKIRLGISTDQQFFNKNLRLLSVSPSTSIHENYKMITGKRSHCINQGNERTYLFENEQKQTFQVVFRTYNDGVVFRYILSASGNETEYVTTEHTTYSIPHGVNRWMQAYTNDYEDFFPLSTDTFNEKNTSHLWGYPALIEPQDSLFVLITEADIRRGHSGSRLYSGNLSDQYQVHTPDEKIAFNNQYISPWRTLIIGSLANIVESTLVTDVSEPCKISNTEWIVPGLSAWIYWANNHGSKDFQRVKEYIDLAQNMGWQYNLIDWEWDVMENGGTVQDAIQYSQQKGIKPMLWYNSGTSWIGPGAPGPLDRLNTKENREKEYAQLKEMGVVGIKIDFFAVDGAKMMNYYIDLLEDAAKYELMINFHGATLPRGWQRTYPNLMTVEAVYGAEWYNNRPTLTKRAASHNATLPFTRNVVGSMDYTPGTFSDSQHPHITSNGHELALPVVFESALQHMPDRPEVYYSLPKEVKQFLSALPSAWDETKLLSGYPGIEVVIARRKDNVWYIGGLNGTDEPRTLNFSLEFLTESSIIDKLIKDGDNDKSFNIENNIKLTDNKKNISVDCLPRGGFVAIIK